MIRQPAVRIAIAGLAVAGAALVARVASPPARAQAPAAAPSPAAPPTAAPEPAPTDDDDAPDTGLDLALPPLPADPAGREAWLAAACDAAVAASPTLAAGDLGAVVVDVATGRALWSHDADTGLNLASVTKVLTTAAALDVLGPGFRWRTSLVADRFDPGTGTVAGDLHVRGRGDPTLTNAGLRDLVRQLTWKGVRRIDGTIAIDGGYFADDGPPPRFDDQPFERAGYRASVSSSSLERNAITVIVVADRAGGGPATVRLDPPGGDYVRVAESAVLTVTEGRTRIRVDSEVAEGRLTLRVSGQIAADDGVSFVRRRVDEPDRLLAAGLRAALADAGIRVKGTRLRHGPPPAAATLVAEVTSPALAEVLRDLGKSSDNFVAETVLKTMGAERIAATAGADGGPRPATWADGQAALHRYLVEVAGLPAGSFRVDNGSGLYDASAVSAAAVAQVLRAGHRDLRVGPELMSSLAIGGVDGTLRKRLAAPTIRGRVRGKTGTLAAVSTLAGYAGTDTARPLAFVVLINRLPTGQRPAARALQDAIATIAVHASAP